MTNAQRAQRLHELGERRRAIETEEHRHRTFFAARIGSDESRQFGPWIVTNTLVDRAKVAAHTRPAFNKISVKTTQP
jgi:hypothetical protein